jgi:hypothetical protein
MVVARDMTAARATRGGLALCAGMLASSVATQPVAAQEGPYSNYLVGERSLGLAGAFVAVADDASAIFHNPGGIAGLPTTSASGSLWALLRGSKDVEDGYRTDLGSVHLEQSAPLALPLFIAGVVKLGPKQKDKVRPHALGAALFTPYAQEDRFVEQLSEEGAVDRLEVRNQDRARWLGVSYGLRLRPGLAFGVSGFYALRELQHDEVELRARETADMAATAGPSWNRASTLNIEAHQVIVRVGTQLDLTPELRAGVMFQGPAIHVQEEGTVETTVTTAGPNPTAIDVQREGDLHVNLPVPWELRMGVTVIEPDKTLLTLDVSLFGPAGNQQNPLPLVDPESVELGAFVPTETYRRTALRGALGFETVIGTKLPLRGGLFFERSSAPPVLSTSDVYTRDHVDVMGASLSIGWRFSGYELSLGATGVFGWGEALALRREEDFAAPVQYEAAEVRTAAVMVFVGGAKSAVKELVQTLME